jgi:hypothetical protein
MCLKQNTSRYNDLQPRCIMDVADRRHKRFEEALRRKLDCVVPRFHCRICQHHNEEAGGICYKHTVRPNQRDHRPRRARPEAANHSGSPRPGSVNRKKGSESTVDIDHITGNVLRYREPQRGSRRLKLAIHRFLKTGFCNAVPLAVLVMLGSVLPALRVPPGEFRPIYRHCHSYPFLHDSRF